MEIIKIDILSELYKDFHCKFTITCNFNRHAHLNILRNLRIINVIIIIIIIIIIIKDF